MQRSALVRTTGHRIQPAEIDPDAAKVIRRLHQFGYDAYIVGGGVRDLLLGRSPKDFDIATSARPNEVRKMFRNCRLIGRRFRLAHILFSAGKIIEVATFRSRPSDADEGDALITDDNEFGTPESDAHRRDFTINALFYDPSSNEVIDYCGGLADLEARTLRTIGEPVVRFREDPVRMLRAVKFAARLGFDIEAETWDAMRMVRNDLRKAAVPRLLEEILRMLWAGAADRSVELLAELGLLDLLLPEVAAFLGRPTEKPWRPMLDLLRVLNIRHSSQASLENGVLLATLFWPPYKALIDDLPRAPHPRHLRPLAEQLVGPAAMRLRIPRRDVSVLLSVLEGQLRVEHSRKRGARDGFTRGPHFPAIVDFFELRAEAEQLSRAAVEEWRALAAAVEAGDDFEDEDGYAPRRRRRRRRR